jgi:hypothetical protein
MKDTLQKLTVALFISCAICFFTSAKAAAPETITSTTAVPIQTLNLTNTLQLEYRYVNDAVKFVAIKNTGDPVKIEAVGQNKIVAKNEALTIIVPEEMQAFQAIISDPSKAPGSFESELSKRTYILILPKKLDQTTKQK